MDDGTTEVTDLILSQKKEEEGGGGERNSAKVEEEKNSGGGVISNLISALVSRNGEEKEEDDGGAMEEREHKEEEEKRVGIFDGLISGILHQNREGGEIGKAEESDQTEHGGGGGVNGRGGLIDNLVSHLHAPLADDAAPATEEASMLIHSIVHD